VVFVFGVEGVAEELGDGGKVLEGFQVVILLSAKFVVTFRILTGDNQLRLVPTMFLVGSEDMEKWRLLLILFILLFYLFIVYLLLAVGFVSLLLLLLLCVLYVGLRREVLGI